MSAFIPDMTEDELASEIEETRREMHQTLMDPREGGEQDYVEMARYLFQLNLELTGYLSRTNTAQDLHALFQRVLDSGSVKERVHLMREYYAIEARAEGGE